MNRAMTTVHVCIALALGLWIGRPAMAQALPLEASETSLKPNLQSVAGVPISRVVGVPEGSNGRVPNSNESTGIAVDPTPGQFRALFTMGGSTGLKNATWTNLRSSVRLNTGTGTLNGTLAAEMGLPVARGTSDQVVAYLRWARVGKSQFIRKSSLSFGSVITVPDVSENGVLLQGETARGYWLPEPFTVNQHVGSGYYWSPHANRLYAVQTGPVSVTWIKAQPYTINTVPNYVNLAGSTSFFTNGANVFLLYTQRKIVSGTPAKQPRYMYWTQKGFQGTGKPINVPTARVGAINIVYNDAFPRTVPAEYQGIGSTSPVDGSTNAVLQELRTLWYEQQIGQIYAYNAEGRVFVEILGMPLEMGVASSWALRLSTLSSNRSQWTLKSSWGRESSRRSKVP